MNANELADLLEDDYWDGRANKVMLEGAKMLRQQQAEIEALKQIIDANNLNQNIGQFVKPTNEPVAWMNKTATSWVSTFIYPETEPDEFKDEWIPLYTHPVKELTDEEIIEIGLLTTDSKFSHIESPLLLEFARAILRKAQK